MLSRSCSCRYPGLLRAEDEANTILPPRNTREKLKGRRSSLKGTRRRTSVFKREIRKAHGTTGRSQTSPGIPTGRHSGTLGSVRATERSLPCDLSAPSEEHPPHLTAFTGKKVGAPPPHRTTGVQTDQWTRPCVPLLSQRGHPRKQQTSTWEQSAEPPRPLRPLLPLRARLKSPPKRRYKRGLLRGFPTRSGNHQASFLVVPTSRAGACASQKRDDLWIFSCKFSDFPLA